VVNWLETFSVGTTMFDGSLAETIIEELDFSYADEGEAAVKWWCIQSVLN
jgi:hypothetical protein